MRMITYLIVFISLISFVQGDYDEQLATNLWYYAAAGYCRSSKIESWNCGHSCSKVPPLVDVIVYKNSTGHDAGFGGYDSSTNSILINFRGTVPWLIKNWIQDIDFIARDYEYCDYKCKVHEGFYKAFSQVQEQLFTAYTKLRVKYPKAKLIVFGHSLGGAMAYHARVYFWSKNVPVDELYTFGSPRVGNKAFFEWFKTTVHSGFKARITHSHDPVPHLPFGDWGFHHVNTEVYYRHFRGKIICQDELQEDNNCSNRNLLDLDINDHLMYMGYEIAPWILLCQ